MSSETNYEGTIRYIPCPNCGSGNPAGAATCARCGKPLQPASKPRISELKPQPSAQPECPKCHKTVAVGSKFCGFCGTPLGGTLQTAAPQPARPPTPSPEAPPVLPKATPQVSAPSISRLSPAADSPLGPGASDAPKANVADAGVAPWRPGSRGTSGCKIRPCPTEFFWGDEGFNPVCACRSNAGACRVKVRSVYTRRHG